LLYLLIFTGYLLLSVVAVLRSRFVRASRISPKLLVALLLLKIAAGLAIGRYYEFQQNADSWGYHEDALVEYRLLAASPREYLLNLFQSGYSRGYGGILSTHDSFWNDLKNNSMVKAVSVLHIFSGGRYYVNVVLFNTLVFFGLVALYRLFREVFPQRHRVLLLPVFLLPSTLLFGSLIHKDGLVLAMLGFVCFLFNRVCKKSGKVWLDVILILFFLTVLFILRNYVVAVLLPALFAWYVASVKKGSGLRWGLTAFSLLFLVFFFSRNIDSRADFLQYTAQKQHDFMALEKGNTTLALHRLDANPISFIRNFPEAFINGLVRPVWGDTVLSKALVPFVLETSICWGLLVLTIFFRIRRNPLGIPFIFPLLFFAFFLCLFTGYIVPVLGAIVRYRSDYLPFLVAPLIAALDFDRIKSLFIINNKI